MSGFFVMLVLLLIAVSVLTAPLVVALFLVRHRVGRTGCRLTLAAAATIATIYLFSATEFRNSLYGTSRYERFVTVAAQAGVQAAFAWFVGGLLVVRR